MLKWCSYCQTFQGEVPPYETLDITHGMCAACEPFALELSDRDIAHSRVLRDIQSRLMAAGRRGDLVEAERIVESARAAGCRPVDILLGLVTPLLCQVGEEWKRAETTVAEEHRFTRFCEGLYQLIAAQATPLSARQGGMAEVLLMNANGNRHTLGLRVLALWLLGKGMLARVVPPGGSVDDLMALIDSARPRLLMISMALSEQSPGVEEVLPHIAALPPERRPRVLVGGHAIKLGLVSPIAGAEFVTDLSMIQSEAWR